MASAVREKRIGISDAPPARATTAEEGAGSHPTLPADAPLQQQVERAVAQALERRDQRRRDQEGESRQRRRDEFYARQAEELGLNDYQKEQMRQIQTDFRDRMRALWRDAEAQRQAGGDPDEAAQRASHQALVDEMNGKAAQVLDSTQYENFLEMQNQAFGPGASDGFGSRRGGR